MKSSLHWFLISSSLAFPLVVSCSTFAAAVEINLGPENSFSGTGTYTPPASTSNADGTVYNFTGNVSIMGAGSPTALTTSCFKENTGNLSFQGNGYQFLIKNMDAGANNAVNNTAAGKTLSLSGFSYLAFIQATNSTLGKGAIKSTGPLSLQSNHSCYFSNNLSDDNGGSLQGSSINLSLNPSLTFQNNTAKGKGGALYSTGALTINNTFNSIQFAQNTAATNGGAIYTEASSFISNNHAVIFAKNSVTGASATGGAIYCSNTATPKPTLTLTDNGNLSFIENSAISSGGAIYTDNLILSSGGPTLFKNNSATATSPLGGAIAIADSGSLSLSADQGDITFEGNTTVKGSSPNQTVTRNAINIGNTNAKIVQLRASQGNAIYFYDPITTSLTAALSEVLNINGPDLIGNPAYQGTIVFSGEKLSDTEAAVPDNLKSTIQQPLNLTGGQLALKAGVTLTAKSFSQASGSTLLMDAGTTLETAEAITVNNLVLNVDSLKETKKATLKTTTASQAITLSGAISLVDSSGDVYEDISWNSPQNFSCLTLTGNTLADVNTTGLASDPIEKNPSHWGYQGNWTLSWQDDAVNQSKVGTLTWTKTGYNPNPERRGTLLPNTLWGSFVDVRSLQNLITIKVRRSYETRGIWCEGISNFLHKDSTKIKKGFRHISAGYVIGATTNLLSDNLITAAFCQLFAKDRDYFINKNRAHAYIGSIHLQHLATLSSPHWFLFRYLPGSEDKQPVLCDGQITYIYTKNNMKTHYTQSPTGQMSWYNDGCALELSASLPHTLMSQKGLFHAYSPFIKLEAAYIHQDSCQERDATFARSFDSSNLINISIPIGITFERLSRNERASYEATFIYVPDIYRNNPDCTTALIINNTSWKTTATNLSRQAAIGRAGILYTFSPYLEVTSNLSMEFRGSSRNYNVDVGGNFSF
ncbi:Polymorphic membrane protein F,chlamydial polymorphic outer membrane protein repeat,Autotransporter beta-domain [Chlamydia serpentis]|uniref:Polymorphic membrane protein F,chlamydial polymorphic outer membrane protein repeat,Autotransporter beta-domain n=1 Tax=Chlamydia serpentis TaxID=1967782 RepID=A0A2R8FB88_9CHLA|nr:polymorphic outer membrane protein middle domain-containing protein [Chlamydia serpentis]SPN73582.1 Polymorphic membrane protein F,chlamydial polymorphic outer membrane protein repeat,Autotransporter beta-domain [Chlamydia serpentis]